LKKNIFLHPFLFTVASIAYLFLTSSVIVSPDQMVRPLFVFWGILILLIFPAYWVVQDWNWSGILLSAVVLIFFSSPIIFHLGITAAGAAIICCFAYFYLRRRSVNSIHIINILNIVSALMVLLIAASIWRQASVLSFFDTPQYDWSDRSVSVELSVPDEKPDVYYIVFDGYGRADILDEYYEYDNSEFIEKLIAKGFVVPAESRSNYPKTVLSISSTLNMDYISNLTPELVDKDTYYWWLMRPLINHSDVRRILESMGYRSYSLTSGWGPTDNSTTDVYYKPAPIVLNDLEYVVLAVTKMKFLTPLLRQVAYVPSFDAHRELFLYNMSALSTISNDDGPKFIFAHIVPPHPPFVFDADGEPLTPGYNYSFNDASDVALSDEEYREGYVNQLKFINTQIVRLVDEILENSKTPPIIILQADHGPGMMTDFGSSENTCMRERFSIFAAYHLPGLYLDDIPQDITAVNLFRIVFNEYFGANYPMLSNYHYYYDETIYIFRDKDVTSIVDTCLTK
jgi:hypothetical protein